ncbi:hypothetical protein BpHYR1_052148 [Brachionus plicatilis]|uniref:Uncharacterized protein n=1 Tax=Brachionus plicatilis TaxID=10195 RepID=A0A3M7R4C8_BRAPC|nr:hypothetical protein BpHYR1_052148 [Brachionus plicatilis]
MNLFFTKLIVTTFLLLIMFFSAKWLNQDQTEAECRLENFMGSLRGQKFVKKSLKKSSSSIFCQVYDPKIFGLMRRKQILSYHTVLRGMKFYIIPYGLILIMLLEFDRSLEILKFTLSIFIRIKEREAHFD